MYLNTKVQKLKMKLILNTNAIFKNIFDICTYIYIYGNAFKLRYVDTGLH